MYFQYNPLGRCVRTFETTFTTKIHNMFSLIFAVAVALSVVDIKVIRLATTDYCGNRMCKKEKPVCGVVKRLLGCQDLESENSTVVDVESTIEANPVRLWRMAVW